MSETIKRSFEMDEENDFHLLQKVLTAHAKRCRQNAESTKQGYGSTKSISKRGAFLQEADECEDLINRMAEIFL
jgi:hypothetical protein